MTKAPQAPNVKHSSASDAWQTPDLYVGKARRALKGRIDFDPASSYEANERIGATRFLDKTEDALIQGWAARNGKPLNVLMNPPGGSLRTADLVATHRLPFAPRRTSRGVIRLNESLPALFWYRLMQLRKAGCLNAAVVVAFSVEALQVTQGLPNDCPSMCDFLVCLPKRRTAFMKPDGKIGSAPPHASAFIYVAGVENDRKAFMKEFEDVGSFMAGKLA